MIIKRIIFILICSSFFSFSQKDSIKKISVSLEQEILASTTLFLLNNTSNEYKNNKEIYLLGGVKMLFNTTKKIKKSLFLDYQFYQANHTYTQPNSSVNILIPNKYIESEIITNLYFIAGVDFRFTNKNKLSGFFTSFGLGVGKYKLKGDDYLYNSKTGWCNKIDFGYVFAYKHLYFKPFVGILSIFNFKELVDYNDGRIITDGNLNYYSQKNPGKSNLYKSSSSPGLGQIEIKYRYAGLTNTTFLPRGLLCIGYNF